MPSLTKLLGTQFRRCVGPLPWLRLLNLYLYLAACCITTCLAIKRLPNSTKLPVWQQAFSFALGRLDWQQGLLVTD